jgi:hypothetical protein
MTNTAVEAATPPTTGIMVMIRSWIDSAEPGTTVATTGQRRKSNTDTTADTAANRPPDPCKVACSNTSNTDTTPDAVPNAENDNARKNGQRLKEEELKFLVAHDLGRPDIGQGARLVR